MGNTPTSDLTLRPDSASPLQASATPDAASGATARATSNVPSMLREMPEHPIATEVNTASERATSGATCCAPPRPQADASNPESPTEHPLLQLTAQQQQALQLLGLGYTDTAVCKRINVNRGTLYRWKTTHPRFMAELARRNTLRQQSSNAAACRARDAALRIVLKHLRSKPGQSLDIAVRLLCSPQLARLTTFAKPSGLKEILAQFQSTRPSDSTSADGLADILQDPSAEVSVPEPAPAPPPQPQSPLFQRIQQATANRHPRKDLEQALLKYGCAKQEVTCLIRRPDLLPFDVHYYRFLEETPASPSLLVSRLTNNGPAGITEPLAAPALHRLAERKLILRIQYISLVGGRTSVWQDCLSITDSTQGHFLFRPERLWRDTVLGWSCEPQAASA